MRSFATLLIAVSIVAAQQVGSSLGSLASTGSTGLSSTNVNNGVQWQNSAASIGSDGGSVLSGITGSSFSKVISNSATTGNNFINPVQVHTQGNSIGDVLNDGFVPFAGVPFGSAAAGIPFARFGKRDATINSIGPQVGVPFAQFPVGVFPQAFYPGFNGFAGFPLGVVRPFSIIASPVQGAPVVGAPVVGAPIQVPVPA
ncbi:hypothetical protein GGI12_005814 [Dipsacomyces acuminosporus]|nr:hypothetical protein GGI12_005814 [Dipsacomyces acuminosporus]